jgi:Glycosyl hydrolases family 2, sugar binding domain/Glycosyl hydrolases family 2, TIM barrel domain/Glycosyl hydrolases family 2
MSRLYDSLPGFLRASLALIVCAAASAAPAAAQAAPSHLRTRWAADVSQTLPWPEYPRPQLVRAAWSNLNGQWDYAITDSAAPQPAHWDGRILVPFAVQSQLSGVQRAVTDSQTLWYHRTFAAPAVPRGGRLLLHFGAVDWRTTVWVNGTRVGEHQGGYDPFTFDVTDALRGHGPQQLIVRVWDPTDRGEQPRGKQVLHPHSIWYSAVTGIWQTVWLEPVPGAYVASLLATPDIDNGTVTVQPDIENAPAGATVRVTALAGARAVATGSAPAGQPVVLHLADAHLWSPSDPYLYGLTVSLSSGDSVSSYFGMRKISVGTAPDGYRRLFLNNAPLFEYGPLDQGWWPDGLYTPPTEAAMLHDLVMTKRLGFNMIRKHVKVESARWYHLADSLGVLVWQDMPSGENRTPAAQTEFQTELHHMIAALRDHPSIVMWIPFNEGWGQFDTRRIVAWIKHDDPTRLVDNATGWTDKGVGDVVDIHDYPGPAMPKVEKVRAAVLGEFGGLGLPLEGHTWLPRNNWGYRTFTDTTALRAAYAQLLDQLWLLESRGLAAAVYTQTTDVEVEVNGLMTYDRAIVKQDPRQAAAEAARLYGPLPTLRTVVPTSEDSAQRWNYTTGTPAAGWMDPGFDDAAWARGMGGFGTDGTPGAVVRTTWNTPDIWMRRTFTLDAIPAHPYWHIHHDEDAELYLNGTLVATLSGYTGGYVWVPFDAQAVAALHTGRNVLALHVHQTKGGQYADVGVDALIRP